MSPSDKFKPFYRFVATQSRGMETSLAMIGKSPAEAKTGYPLMRLLLDAVRTDLTPAGGRRITGIPLHGDLHPFIGQPELEDIRLLRCFSHFPQHAG
jgi:hypothetical protein